MRPGAVIVVNGASSAGKSTLCRAAQPLLPRPFLRHGLDSVFFGDVLPRDADGRVREWSTLRPRIVDGFLRGLRGYAEAGVDVICDHVLEPGADRAAFDAALTGLDVFWVGLHVPLDELERRERARGDRGAGDARRDLETVHAGVRYDLELDGTAGLDACARRLAEAWAQRQT